MPHQVQAASNHPLFAPPQRSSGEITKDAVIRARQNETVAAVAAQAQRAKARGTGTRIDVVA